MIILAGPLNLSHRFWIQTNNSRHFKAAFFWFSLMKRSRFETKIVMGETRLKHKELKRFAVNVFSSSVREA